MTSVMSDNVEKPTPVKEVKAAKKNIHQGHHMAYMVCATSGFRRYIRLCCLG